MNRLLEIVADVRVALYRRMAEHPLEQWASRVTPRTPGAFQHAVTRPSLHEPVRVIAELKRRSPSRGSIREDMDPLTQAGCYQRGGASAISVLTEELHFHGSPEALRRVSASVPLPTLQKDFVLEDYQLFEAVERGAAAALLIVSILPPHRLLALLSAARSLGLDALVEVHDEAELDQALEAGAQLIGVNNRNLETFEVDLRTSERLAVRTPEDRVLVGESGILERADVERLEACGVDAVLVGEALMRAEDPESKLRELRGVKA